MYPSVRVFGIAFLLFTASARAEISVSVTINGSLEEITAVLQHLQTMGAGHAAGETGEELKLQVHSITSGELQTAQPEVVWVAPGQEQPAPAAAPASAPVLALQGLVVNPASAPAGASVVITAQVVDEAHVIDTMSSTFGDGGPVVDLYDNGTNGDATAGDGTWSGTLLLPADAAAGASTIRIEAFDSNGGAVTVSGAEGTAPLAASADFTVAP